jgi:dTDP-4-amino-4,6-dideoxygalactose transaminase
MIPVTKSFLPPIEEYMSQVQRAYNNSWLTNRGELVKELEHKLNEYIGLNDTQILCMSNGTVPIQLAIKLLANGGEVITTPFSYVATTAAIAWEGCKPIFVDIHPEYLTIDESKIEAAITPKTTCILATHVFGNPCNVEEIDRIAKKHNLKVIYDGAHSFGVKYKGKPIFEYGDVSTCSFHATKLFHTGEGGAIFTKDSTLFNKIFLSHTFGHIADDYYQVGINGKMSELSAAMGLAVLPSIEDILIKRKNNFLTYQFHLNKHFKTTVIRPETDYNFSYIPIIFESEEILLKVKSSLESNNIFPRRYFYPSLNTISFYNSKNKMPISESIACSVLCLPNFFELTNLEIENITKIILRNL